MQNLSEKEFVSDIRRSACVQAKMDSDVGYVSLFTHN